MEEPPSTASIAAAIVQLAERQRAISAQRQATWGASIAAAPPAMCATHPGQALTTDLERSAFESAKNRRVTIVCHECPRCAEDRVRQRLAKRLIARGIPPRSLDITLETWDPAWEPTRTAARGAAWKAVDAWAKNREVPFLIILGAKGGTGKTALAVAALRAVAPSDPRCIEYREFIAELIGLDQEEQRRRIKGIRHYAGLLIDDFGNRHIGTKDNAGGNAFERDAMAAILNYRFEERLPTILTSNLDPVAFAGRLDDRTVDRIKAGRVYIDASDWPSKRATEAI